MVAAALQPLPENVAAWRRFKLERKPRERWKLCVDCGHPHLTAKVCTACTCGHLNCAAAVVVAAAPAPAAPPVVPPPPPSAPRLRQRGPKPCLVLVDDLASSTPPACAPAPPPAPAPEPSPRAPVVRLPQAPPIDVRRMTRDEIARLPPGPRKTEAWRLKSAIEAGVPGVPPRRPR